MSTLVYALHRIERIVDGESRVYDADQVHDFDGMDDKEGKRLLEIGAIREPSEDETAVYNAKNGDTPTSKAAKKGKSEPKLDDL